MNTRELIEKCRDALAEELGAWDIDPPLFHVKEAHDACVEWLAAPAAPAASIPQVVRNALEAAFERRPGWQSLLAPAVRALGDAPAAPAGDRFVSVRTLERMRRAVVGTDPAQPGYLIAKGWNYAIRQAMDYAAPAAPAPVPLTRDQVKALMTECGYDQAGHQERADFINGIRYAEQAHGIGNAMAGGEGA